MYCAFLAVDGGTKGWRERLGGKVTENAVLARHTTYQVGGPAKYLVVPSSTADVGEAFGSGEEVFVMGAGSNILASDDGFPGIVLKVFNTLSHISFDDGEVVVGAGRTMASLVKSCEENGFAGMEWAVGIPGTVGGAACTNAGAFGGALWEKVSYVEVITADNGTVRLGPAEVDFAYRRARFPMARPFAVTEVALSLGAASPAAVRARTDEYRALRQATQPVGAATAGCVFKNPPDGPAAGALIDRAGLKGTRVGAAVISAKHANFIVNEGGAAASDIYRLIAAAREKVERDFGVSLELEIELLGEFGRG